MRDEKLIEEYKKLTANISIRKKELFGKIKESASDIVDDYICVDSNICVILSCPGEEEMINNKVAFGQTGKNILEIFKIIHSEYGSELSDFSFDENGDQYQLSILNSFDHVFFREVNSAEPDESLIISKENIDRLKESIGRIKNLQYLVLCGNNAETVFNLMSISKKVKKSFVSHLGFVGIRNKYKNSYLYDGKNKLGDLPPNNRDKQRFKIIAKDIVSQWNNEEEDDNK